MQVPLESPAHDNLQAQIKVNKFSDCMGYARPIAFNDRACDAWFSMTCKKLQAKHFNGAFACPQLDNSWIHIGQSQFNLHILSCEGLITEPEFTEIVAIIGVFEGKV